MVTNGITCSSHNSSYIANVDSHIINLLHYKKVYIKKSLIVIVLPNLIILIF